jgi:hypothetical protein
MNTLFDYITHVNGLTYILALASIAGFVVFLELFKSKPFAEILESAREDYRFIKELGAKGHKNFMKKAIKAPFIAMAYLISIPFLFMRGLGQAAGEIASTVAQPGWSPVRAYFTGKSKGKKASEQPEENQESAE